MIQDRANAYDIDPHVAEICDQIETHSDDVALVRKLIAGHGPLRILEPFCGTGRILIPLILDDHRVVGLGVTFDEELAASKPFKPTLQPRLDAPDGSVRDF